MSQRYLVVAITACAAVWLYIDRVCLSTLAGPIQTDLGLTDREKASILGAFFFTYALFQIPIGAIADRFGPRLVLTVSIASWSAVTVLTGFAWTFVALLVIRLTLGVAQAGTYPAAAALVKSWAQPEERGQLSSVVALGGRIGGAFAPWLTGMLAPLLAGLALAAWLNHNPSGVNWRAVFVLYGVCGLAVAVLFWALVRDRPAHGSPTPQQTSFGKRLLVISTNPNMWLFGALQFCINISWVVLITLLPEYLQAQGLPFEQVGNVQSMVLFGGCVGMVAGGFVSDLAHRRLGPRWGRAAPLGVIMTLCGLMCGVVSSSPGLWIAVGALGLMALCQDLGVPALWAYAQDVGGQNVGAALGWGNMLGNFGAALSPILLTEVRLAGGWTAAFALCAACYFVSAACGMLLDASRPIE